MCSWWSMDATATNGGADMTADDNRAAVTAADLTDHVVWRTAANRSALQHNKFLVLTNNDQPVAVWTGSTNLTQAPFSGISMSATSSMISAAGSVSPWPILSSNCDGNLSNFDR